MRPGPLIRRLFGPGEHWVAEAYRRMFVNLDVLANLMGTWVPRAQNILEVGCGEGAMTERIARIYPAAAITAIDISPRVGRLFRGSASRVTFSQRTVEDVAAKQPASFDLVLLADVIHHVPTDARSSLLCAINQAMAPSGSLIFKDWVVSPSPIHHLCALFDRFITGDDVEYYTIGEMNALLTGTFGAGTIRQRGTVRPWQNNVAVLVQR